MSDETEYPDDDAVLAAEYVLGLLPADEAQGFAHRLIRDPALRDLCDTWSEHFAELAEQAEEVRPPPAIWRAIQARVFERRKPLWRRLWLGQALVGGALAAGIALAVLRLGWLEPQALPLSAALTTEGAGEVARIALDPDSGEVMAELVGLFPDPGRARELWLIQGDNAPVSLGLLAPGVVVALAVPQDLRAALAGAVLAISDEPTGGSPTGQPTGAVLATGAITAS
ncbi:MAG: hypothetical protein EP318_05060 [Rhodobacteraceae bacterium]|nr:MAG: hypothetical protein EP318_05060 [Paracoccaceae bacterium]